MIIKLDKKLRRETKLKFIDNEYVNYNTLLRFLLVPDNRNKLEEEIGEDGFIEIIHDLMRQAKELYDYKNRKWYEF